MSQKKNQQSEQMDWLNSWSAYLTQPPFSHSSQPECATQILQQLVQASLQGDSCIEFDPTQLEALGDLVVSSDV
ncbi:MAG TPA: exodeoxyribonuclease V subunit alpha, partial [Acinetobacter sp.]|nr:exodeoxyribonuclease V subunit alpha [Acinetobacter sp.]